MYFSLIHKNTHFVFKVPDATLPAISSRNFQSSVTMVAAWAGLRNAGYATMISKTQHILSTKVKK